MGNIHFVRQVSPVATKYGAAIRVSPSFTLLASAIGERLPGYAFIETVPIRINLEGFNGFDGGYSETAVFLTVRAGNKMWNCDYPDDLLSPLTELAPFLDDALFYFGDEESGFVHEWRIKDGKLTFETVRESDSSIEEFLGLPLHDDDDEDE